MKTKTRPIDAHVHLWSTAGIDNMKTLCNHIGADRMSIACIFDKANVNYNPPAFAAKAKHPDTFYIFASLDHTARFTPEAATMPSLVEQVDRLVSIGVDGIKMLENKPTHRRMLDIPVDGPYFEEYFAHMERIHMPIQWHVCDPEEFWDPEITPGWAKKRGWGYDETFRPKEQLYAEVEKVLVRHPGLKIAFTHFYFLSADLPRAAALLDRFPGVYLDLAPGIEYLYNMSRDVLAAREFFARYEDRIIFGTDISDYQTPDQALIRSQVVTRWLGTNDEYRVPDGADFLLGPPEDGIMRGLDLPADVLTKIYRANFEGLVGRQPRVLNAELAGDECRRIAEEVRASGGDSSSAEAAADILG